MKATNVIEPAHKIPLVISHVEIIPFRPKLGHLGFASCILNNQFYLGDIAIFSRSMGGIRLGFPIKKLADGNTVDVCKPLNETIEKIFESAISRRYEMLIKGNGKEVTDECSK